MSQRSTRASLVLAALLLTACGGGTDAGPLTYTVTYRLDLTGGIAIDSVKYDDGHGALVKVATPASAPGSATWVQSISATQPASVEARAWGQGAPGSTAKLKITWTISGVSSISDSSTVATSAPGQFSLTVTKRTI